MKWLKSLLALPPMELDNVEQSNLDKEILRLSIIAEEDAISLYEQMAEQTDNENLKKVLLDVAKEEKVHVGEFQALLISIDKEYAQELEEGKKEVGDLIQTKEIVK